MKPTAVFKNSLAFGCTTLATATLISCSLYRSSDRENFDSNALAGAPKTSGQEGVAPSGCGAWISKEEAAQAFSLPAVELAFTSAEPSAQACRISAPASEESTKSSASGADTAVCARTPDTSSLIAEGLDLISQDVASLEYINKKTSQFEFALARKSLSGDTAAVCRFTFTTKAELDESLALIRARAESLTRALVTSTSAP